MDEFFKSVSIGFLLRNLVAGCVYTAACIVFKYGASAPSHVVQASSQNLSAYLALSLVIGILVYSIHRAVFYPVLEAIIDHRWTTRGPPIGIDRLILPQTVERMLRRWDYGIEDAKRPYTERAKHIANWADYAHLQYASGTAILLALLTRIAFRTTSAGWWWIAVLVIALLVFWAAALVSDWRLRVLLIDMHDLYPFPRTDFLRSSTANTVSNSRIAREGASNNQDTWKL